MMDNPTKKVHAFDPGITTGYATGVIENGSMGAVSGQERWVELDLYLQLKRSEPDIIVYERFESRPKADVVELFSRNLIGVINLYIQERLQKGFPVECHTQMPATVLGNQAYFNDKRLKAEKLYKVRNPHANDAMRHLLYWFFFGPGFKYNTSNNPVVGLA